MYKNKLSYYFCCFCNKNKNTNNTNKQTQEDTFNVLNENNLTEKLCRTPTSIDINIKNKPYSLSNDMTLTFVDIYG
jgi:hypothetical protein